MRLVYALVPALALAISQITTETPQFFTDLGSKRVSISYGPYTVPPRSMMDGMKDFTEAPAKMPCTDCLITFIQADLLYANGTQANPGNGLWLHHTVLVNSGETDLVCPVGPQRFFASGNERTPMNFCVNGTDKAGYYVSPSAHFGMTSELMNMGDTEAEAFVSVTYEYISSSPASFGHVQPLWLDIGPSGGCKGSDRPAFANSTFNYSSPGWTAKTDGYVVGIGSHIHDGGTNLEVKNNGKVVCDSVAKYGGSSAYIETMSMNMTMNGMPMEMNMTMEDISYLSTCHNIGSFKAGSVWGVTAYYNTSEHLPMQNTDGTLEGIMGISLVYFVEGDYVNTTTGSHTLKGAMTTASATGSTASPSASSHTNGAGISAAFTSKDFWGKLAAVMILIHRIGL